jgi:hypothetical protein
VSSFWRGGHFLGAWVLQFEKKNGIIYVIITIFLWILSYFNDGMLSRVVDIIYSVIMAVDAYRISK